MPNLEIIDLKASYGKVPVLDGISLSVDSGEVLGLIGPSGSGKSTILRVLVGLLKPTSGRVLLDSEEIKFDRSADIRNVRNRLAIVFQQYNLFQNMTVIDNITIAPIKIRGWSKSDVVTDAERLLKLVGLGDKLKAYPDQLSGGQQQRVAIARALALKPEILLLDEITAALDPELVSEVLDTIRLLAADGMTMLIVSHEMGFVREVSSQVAFMDEGKVIEIGTPGAVFDTPREVRTQDFVSKILRH
ncbi:MAG: amino acid ABC transporter ATP-binding protein [Hyphomicrobiaceae bacterium]